MLDIPQLGVQDRGAACGRGGVRVRRRGPRARLHRRRARARGADRAPRGHRGRDEPPGSTASTTSCTPAQSMEVPAGTPHAPAPARRRRGPRARRRCAPAATPARSSSASQEIVARPAASTASAIPSPSPRRRIIRDFGAEAHATKPPVPRAEGVLARRAGARASNAVHVRRRVGRRGAARGGVRRDLRRAQLPGVVEPGLHRRRRRRPGRARQDLAPALQGPPPVPPAHRVDDRAPRARRT